MLARVRKPRTLEKIPPLLVNAARAQVAEALQQPTLTESFKKPCGHAECGLTCGR
jgi:hypothetical protein